MDLPTKKMKNSFTIIFLLFILLIACSPARDSSDSETLNQSSEKISDDSLLTLVQYQTFQYFWENAEPVSGLARERTHMDGVYPQNDKNVVTSGGSGFGIMAILVGIERGFITREQAVERYMKILDFLEGADKFHGVWPHWWDGETGKVQPFSKNDDGGDLVETAFLVQGLLTVREYFRDSEDEREQKIVKRINQLWEAVEWSWHTQGGQDVLYWHWSPNYGWEKDFNVEGYNECLIMYVLAASSPTYPVEPDVYHKGWARDGAIANDTSYMGYETELDYYAMGDHPIGPLFWSHYSYLGLNPNGLSDNYADYNKLTVNHARIHYDYCVENPKGYEGYGEKCWGLTSSYSMRGYAGHRPETMDLGVISPTAALSSFPYTPTESMQLLRFLYDEADSLVGEYGPYDAFSFEADWYTPRYLAIDQGPIPVMIENHRTGLLWELFMKAPEVQMGLEKLGFEIKK